MPCPTLSRNLPSDVIAGEARRAIARRAFLAAALAVSAGGAGSATAQARIFQAPEEGEAALAPKPMNPSAARPLALGDIPADFWQQPRTLTLKRQATSEVVTATYWQNGEYVAEGYWRICALLRDVKANKMTTMDLLLLDLLRGMQGFYQAWGRNDPIIVLSGFRTLETNADLVLTEGAARNSMHLYGRAVDVTFPGVPPVDIGNLARYFRVGGVGFYVDQKFVHIDTGPQRQWVARKR